MDYSNIKTISQLKDELYKTRFYMSEMAKLHERLRQAMDGAYNITPSYSGMPQGGGDNSSKQERAIIAADTISQYIRKDIQAYEQAIKANMDLIDKLDGGEERSILQARFLYGDSMQSIADAKGYTERQCYRIYRQALQDILAKIKDVSECQ